MKSLQPKQGAIRTDKRLSVKLGLVEVAVVVAAVPPSLTKTQSDMKQNEINAICKRYEKAVEAEKEAKQIQRDCFRQLKAELFKFKNLLIETGDINFGTPISCDGGAKFVVGLFYDDRHKFLFPKGCVRLKVTEHGVFDKNNGVHETALILAKALEFATIEANRMFK